MQKSKRSSAPVGSKSPPVRAGSQRLGFFETSGLHKQGKIDGHRALPKKDESGAWVSPMLRRESDLYQEQGAKLWRDQQDNYESDHREIKRLCLEIDRLWAALSDQRDNAPSEADLFARKDGEDNFTDHLVKLRRSREHESRNKAYYEKLRQNESDLENCYRRLAEHLTVIRTAEEETRMACEWAYTRAEQRITVYLQGVHQSHPKFMEIPDTLEIPHELKAETLYHSQHQQTNTDVARLLARQHQKSGGDSAADTNRMEEKHVTKKTSKQVSR